MPPLPVVFLSVETSIPYCCSELLQDMVADSQRAGEVIRGIRSLVRKETMCTLWVNLNSASPIPFALLARISSNRESVVTTELDPHVPQVQAALVQIQQVLLNLIINSLDAVEHMPPAQRRIIIRPVR